MDLCEEAHRIVEQSNLERTKSLSKLLQLCESPVEQMLLATLLDRWLLDVVNRAHGLTYEEVPEPKKVEGAFSTIDPTLNGIFTVICEPQKPIKVGLDDVTYRADLYIWISRYRGWLNLDSSETKEVWPSMAKIIVEVDGHDFHERTKRQASRDRKRERELTLEGYRVIRFTGSDVYNNPHQCVTDIQDQLEALANNVFHDYTSRGKLEELILGE